MTSSRIFGQAGRSLWIVLLCAGVTASALGEAGRAAGFAAAETGDSRGAAPLSLAAYEEKSPPEGNQPPAGESPPPAERRDALTLGGPSYLLSSERITPSEVGWPGFLTGTRDFDGFADPVGNPLYFESPFAHTSAKFLYLWHKFPEGNDLGGGDLNVFALQLRLALTDRLAFIATKDGYSRLRAGILPADDGWNDAAIGLKYAFYQDKESQMVWTGGLRWEWHNGSTGVLQGGSDELSPFISFAKGWDRFHMLGNVTGRLPMDSGDGNYILSYDLHFDYEIAPTVLPGFLPLVEFHGMHYLSDGDRLPLGVGAMDYSNIGSNNVAGNSVYWCGIGWEWKLTPHLALASTYEFPLHTTDTDIMDQRVTATATLRW